MRLRGFGLIFVLILIVVLEFLFNSSHINFLIGFRLIYIFALLLFEQKKIGSGIVFLLFGSALIEFLSFQDIIGLTGLSMFLSIAAATVIYRFISFPGSTESYARLISILVGAILIKHLVYVVSGYSSTLDAAVVFINIVIMFIAITVLDSIRKPQ